MGERCIEQTKAEARVSTTNAVDDALSKILDPDRGHVRGLGFGVTHSKLSLLSQQDHKYKILEKEYLKMKEEMIEMKAMKDEMIETKSIDNINQIKCKLLDWYGSGEIVVEGRWSSNDPTALVHHVPIGPHAIRVWVDVAKKPNAYLCRPTSEMTCIEEALRSTVA
ncbi:Plant transposase [Cucumis melo var. makuwa]|uniref:Plant transposase n=1 Tax=Cucumis melo var. makuwa TaxID=1194695 RepID=A0A5D3DYA1_CUCMM|nr:Plant transposase [Cucumis melo var. makuwa]TYK28686.1 Plant transposase [Cucumis melo var. makuwa]